jgi:hypothetical protein
MPIPVTLVSEPSESALRIRRAVPDDAAAIVSVLATVAAERVHSAIDRIWTVEQERSYLELLSPCRASALERHRVFRSRCRLPKTCYPGARHEHACAGVLSRYWVP